MLSMGLRYAARKLDVFPINPANDVPYISWGKYASHNEHDIKRWVAQHFPDLLWGIALPPNLAVVDIDVKNRHDGFAAFERLMGCHPDALDTWQSSTPSGGRHVWFDTDGHKHFRNTESQLGDGLDTRAYRHPREGDPNDPGGKGMVKVPPFPGRRWLIEGRSGRLLAAPQQLKDYFKPRTFRPPGDARPAVAEHSLGGLALLAQFTYKIANAEVGKRDKTRTRYAFMAGQLVGGGELNEAMAWQSVLAAAQAAIDGTGPEATRKEKYLENTFLLGKRYPWVLGWGDGSVRRCGWHDVR
jgi:hypothetical protein